MIIQQLLILSIFLEAATSEGDAIYLPPQDNRWKFESTETMSRAARTIIKKVLSVEQAEGVGARVRRSVGRPEVRMLYIICLYCEGGNPILVKQPLPLLMCYYACS